MTSVVEHWKPVIVGGKGWKEACFVFWLRQKSSDGINAPLPEWQDQRDPGLTEDFVRWNYLIHHNRKYVVSNQKETKTERFGQSIRQKPPVGGQAQSCGPSAGTRTKLPERLWPFFPPFLSRHGLNRDLSPSHARYSRSWHKNDIWPESKFICGLGATTLAKESLWLRTPLFIMIVRVWISKQWKGQADWPQVPSRSVAAEEGGLFPQANGDKDTTRERRSSDDGKKEECGGKIGGERSSCRCLIHAYGWHNVTVMQFVLGQKPSCSHPPQFRWLICRSWRIKEQLLMLLTRVRGQPSLLDVTAW